ncbi:MAG: helix-turn-helix transcriptional regulator [Tissierellales bacterium]|nr:helix-turn-helix transcriptional regulator [Tissierellales bacterium]
MLTKIVKELLDATNMKIVMYLMENKYATKKDLETVVTEISQASLYRHLKSLVKNDIIEIYSKEQKRGTFEKTYKLKYNPNDKIGKVVENSDPKEIYEIFYTFIISQLLDFDNYLKNKTFNLKEDRTGFRSFPLTLTNEECDEMNKELGQILKKYMNINAKENSRLRKFSITSFPVNEED